MTTDNDEIKTLEQAKRYFISMGCSHFHLDREDFDRAKEYRSLKISSATESLWRQEEFDRQLSNFPNTDKDNFGFAYSSLAYISETTDYYLQHLNELANRILKDLSGRQINYCLISVIGNDSTNTHGGLIQKANSIQRHDLRGHFISIALSLIDQAEKEHLDITFLRGNLADIIEHYKIIDLKEPALRLRTKGAEEGFKYYELGANEGNIFSMNMLAKYFREGKGCKTDVDKARYWEQKAKE